MILRAGPAADFTDSFLELSTDPSAPPVNCAKDFTNTAWPFKILLGDFVTYSFGTIATDTTDFSGSDNFNLVFAYQAVNAFTIDLDYVVSGVDDGSNTIFNVFVDGAGVFSDAASGLVSGTATINLPATVTPVIVDIQALPNITGTYDVTLDL